MSGSLTRNDGQWPQPQPPPQQPPLRAGAPARAGAAAPPPARTRWKLESCFSTLAEPQDGQRTLSAVLSETSSSKSAEQPRHAYS